MKPAISVLMPVYNAEKFLEQAISSVLNQTFSDFELLVFDDGSTDKSREVIESFSDPRIIFFPSNENKGHIFHLNHGLEVSRGEFIARMDADDICLPSRFEKQINLLRADASIGICGTSTLIMNEAGEEIRKENIFQHDNNLRIRLITNTCFSHPTVMIRKSILTSNNFKYEQELFPAEDYAFWVLISTRSKLANIPETLLRYRWHAQQISQSKKQIRNEAVERVQVIMIQKFIQRPLSEQERNLHLSLINSRFKPTKEYVTNARNWLQFLLETNADTLFFDTALFSRYINGIWFSLCTNSYSLGPWIVSVYRSSSVGEDVTGFPAKIKFIGKSLLRFSPVRHKINQELV